MKGNLHKMVTELGNPIKYLLRLGGKELIMNDLIGKEICLSHTGIIHCVSCQKITKKSFGQGFCYSCFIKSPMNSECIIRPELCEAHLGKGRDPEWEKKHHLQEHIVYLAFTDKVKVGVTRTDQIPTRWIDQGAHRAIVLARVPYRRLAGEIEVALKEVFDDKTNWRNMLKNILNPALDPIAIKEEALEDLPEEMEEFYEDEHEVYEMHYPVTEYPSKITSLNLDKTPEIKAQLLGIKGQYLILSDHQVLNIRKHSGYEINLSTVHGN